MFTPFFSFLGTLRSCFQTWAALQLEIHGVLGSWQGNAAASLGRVTVYPKECAPHLKSPPEHR